MHAALVLRPGNAPVSEEERERLDAVEGFGSVEGESAGASEGSGSGVGTGVGQKSRDGLRYVDAWLQGKAKT